MQARGVIVAAEVVATERKMGEGMRTIDDSVEAPCSRAIATTSRTGRMFPVRFTTWVISTTRVFAVIASRNRATTSPGAGFGPPKEIRFTTTPSRRAR